MCQPVVRVREPAQGGDPVRSSGDNLKKKIVAGSGQTNVRNRNGSIQDQRIQAGGVENGVASIPTIENVRVVAGAALQMIGSRTTVKRVVARAAINRIVARAAG